MANLEDTAVIKSVITVKDLVLKKGKTAMILKGLNATFESGKLNAIMGPNGCGKTTFLNIFFGNSESDTSTSGEILLDGEQRDKEKWFEDVSFVYQSTYLIEKQTVSEAFQLAIDLSNSKHKNFV